jgi:hypothetical protein
MGITYVGCLTLSRQFCLRHPEVRDVCDIGQYLFWDSKIAWYLTAIMFLLNNIFIQVIPINSSQEKRRICGQSLIHV